MPGFLNAWIGKLMSGKNFEMVQHPGVTMAIPVSEVLASMKCEIDQDYEVH
jgi:hypothetical protein